MTRQEAIEILRGLKPTNTVSITDAYTTGKALTMTIKALEQEPILDKIRAEIVEMRSKQNCSCADCLDIIDKYKAESENP